MDLTGLNDAQLAAVTAGPGPHLVIAGAGTGKTRTLVHRVAWLIDEGVPPNEIVLLTFTRRAANEMLERVVEMVGPGAKRVRGGTFHSFANRVLRRHIGRLGYDRNFTILDQGDAESLLGACRTELGYGGRGSRFAQRGTVFRVLSRSLNTGVPVAAILEEEYPQYADDADAFERIGARYAERKRAQSVVDFDDLLALLLKVLREFPAVRKQVSGRIQHVLVDEYQDTNLLQAQIAGLLSVEHGNLMVVGDEAQSIYAFRGAVVENILKFPERFEGTQMTVLEENYRSVQPVLDLANGVLASSYTGYDKRLRSEVDGGERPVWVSTHDEHDQAELVVQQVLNMMDDGVDLRDQAVLFRSGAHANFLEVALNEAGIPYRKFGGKRFTESAHIKDVQALLRIVANPRDELAWTRVLQWFSGLGAKSAARISAEILESADVALDPEKWRRRKFHADLVELAGLVASAVDRIVDDFLGLVEALVAWYRQRIQFLYEDWTKRIQDLDVFLLLAERYPDLETMLSQLALDPVRAVDEDGEEVETWLTLSTIHSAKGLEWDVVYVLSLADGAFPNGYALDSLDQLEEERRLFYVAVTRARQALYLLSPKLIRVGGRGNVYAPRCTLLSEVRELYDLVDEASPSRSGSYASQPVRNASTQDRLDALLDWYD
jgi:DNA helicase-2/ATP-dependent DNA helicase PcrA